MRSVVFFMVLTLVVGAGTATAAEVTLNPTADAPVFAHPSYINRNMGSQTYGYWGFYNYPFRTFCKYDCSAVSGTVTKVELQFRLMQNNYATGKMWACKVNARWTETGVTWANQPAHDDNAATGRMLDIDWVSGNGPHTIITGGNVVEALARQLVQRGIQEAQRFAGHLIGNSDQPGPLRC